jgi:hypothetical protein
MQVLSGRFQITVPEQDLNGRRSVPASNKWVAQLWRLCLWRHRHTMAMDLLQAGADRSVIALWLGHESVETTQIYLEATLAMKERALAKTLPPHGRPGRYQPGDQLLGFLNSL